MACAKTCVLLCHCCRCCCKDYTELFYLLTARSVYPYNFCMSYSMCTCVCEGVLHMALSRSLSAHRGRAVFGYVAVCVLLFCARLHVQISTTISSSMAMKVAALSLSLSLSYSSVSLSLSMPSRTHHRLVRTAICVCNQLKLKPATNGHV